MVHFLPRILSRINLYFIDIIESQLLYFYNFMSKLTIVKKY